MVVKMVVVAITMAVVVMIVKAVVVAVQWQLYEQCNKM